jgi:hypothetical protein
LLLGKGRRIGITFPIALAGILFIVFDLAAKKGGKAP